MSATVISQSLCMRCAVCEGQGRVELVMWEGHVSSTQTTMGCPHCSNLDEPVPYLEVRLRRDVPWGGAAS